MEIVKSIEPYGDFYVYGEQTEKVADILGMSEADLKDNCQQNGVAYLAVDKANTKQIKVTHIITDFSNSIINLSNLSDSNISALVPNITGVEGAMGEIIKKDGQKFIKAQFKTNDSGGEYILTQYITVAERNVVALSFYTSSGESTNYIEETFESFESPLFITEKQAESSPLGYVLLVAAIVFAVACAVIIFTIIKDIKKDKTEEITSSGTVTFSESS